MMMMMKSSLLVSSLVAMVATIALVEARAPLLVGVSVQVRAVSAIVHDDETGRETHEHYDVALLQAQFDAPVYVTGPSVSTPLPWSEFAGKHHDSKSLDGIIELRCSQPNQTFSMASWKVAMGLRTVPHLAVFPPPIPLQQKQTKNDDRASMTVLERRAADKRIELRSAFRSIVSSTHSNNMVSVLMLLSRDDNVVLDRSRMVHDCSLEFNDFHPASSTDKPAVVLGSYHGRPVANDPSVDWHHHGLAADLVVYVFHVVNTKPNKPRKQKATHPSTGGSAEEDPEKEARERRRRVCENNAVFLQQKMVFLEEGLRQVNAVIDPVGKVIAKPIADQTLGISAKETLDRSSQDMVHSMVAGLPRLVAGYTTPAVSRNVTNLVADAVTGTITDRIVPMVVNQLGPFLSKAIWKNSAPPIHRHLEAILEKHISADIIKNLPITLWRGLPMVMTIKLTSSLTHTLVPILARSLKHSKRQEATCATCSATGKGCSNCQYSGMSSYYTNYYSAYYSDYYSEYYSEYFFDALRAVDTAIWRPDKMKKK